MEDDNNRLDLSSINSSSMASPCVSSIGSVSTGEDGEANWDSDDYDDKHGSYYYDGEMNSDFDEDEGENEQSSDDEIEVVPDMSQEGNNRESRSVEYDQPAEILEENNNDPNNNMDDGNEGEGNATNEPSAIESELEFEEWERLPVMPVSPQPGCSKHFDAVENIREKDGLNPQNLLMNYSSDLVEQANGILALVKKLTFGSVINALKEKKGKKIFLADLLPKDECDKKRHHDGDICDISPKKQMVLNTSEASTSTAMENSEKPEEVLKYSAASALRLSPGLKVIVQEAETPEPSPISRNTIPISISSSDDEASPIRILETINIPPDTGTPNGLNLAAKKTTTVNEPSRNTEIKSTMIPSSTELQIKEFDAVLNETRKRNALGAMINNTPSSPNRAIKSLEDILQFANHYVPLPKTSSNSTTMWNGTPNSTETLHTEVRPHRLHENNITYLNQPSTSVPAASNSSGAILKKLSVVDSHRAVDNSRRIMNQPSIGTLIPPSKIIRVQNQQPMEIRPGTSSSTVLTELRDVVIKSANVPPREKIKLVHHKVQHGSTLLPACTTTKAAQLLLPSRPSYQAAHSKADHPIDSLINRVNTGFPHTHIVQRNRPPHVINVPNDPVAFLPDLPHHGNKKFCQEIYVKLRAMFPRISPKYIQRFCPEDWNPRLTHDTEFGQIVESLFTREAEWEYDDTDLNEEAGAVGGARTLDETYEHLLELFPDAEPGHIRTIAENHWQNEDQLNNYIDSNLQNPSYPTREQYLAQLKITEEQKRYTTNFNIDHFLEIFPDPKKYFEDPARVPKDSRFNHVAFEFLKSVFKKHRVNTINRIYKANNWNMSITARILSTAEIDMKGSRYASEYPTTHIPLLQEMAYVKHRADIERHLEMKLQGEKEEFERLKAKGELIECQCCFDSECMPSKCSTCDEGHFFCNSCILNGTNSRLGDGETHVPCFLACGSEFSLSTLQKVMKPTKFSILLKKRQAAEVMAAAVEGLVACPFCHFATIPPEGDKVFKCLNPDCMKESCIQCKEPNHVPLRCDEVGKADKTRKIIEEKMTEALSRRCYQCKKLFIKEEGCNKITCPCGAHQCYLCDKPIKDYSHFRGQGSDDVNKCPLHSDNSMLNWQTVKKVAEEVKKQLLAADPTLIIDTDSMLPLKPKATQGPHQQIAGDPNLAAIHAARVLGKRHL